MRRRLAAAAALLASSCALAACGIGAGEPSSDVSVLVTRDFGTQRLGEFGPAPTQGQDTVMRLLQREFRVTTRFGGGFVQSIDGLAGGREDGRRVDWFYFVNGIEASKGAADTRVNPGDAIWWDRRPWDGAMRIPAVVGSFPEPFVNGQGGDRFPTRIECEDPGGAVCEDVVGRLRAQDLITSSAPIGTTSGDELTRVLVGTWPALRKDRAATLIERGPRESGVFARPSADGRALALLDDRGRTARTLGPGSGLVAATRLEPDQATWVVTGTDAAGVAAAAKAFDEQTLSGRFAVAISSDNAIALPVTTR